MYIILDVLNISYIKIHWRVQMQIKTIKTEKAQINIMSNNTVEKVFLDNSQAEKEYESLCWLYDLFSNIDINDWTYKTVKPLSYNESKIVMEVAEGVPYQNLLKRKPISSYLAGN